MSIGTKVATSTKITKTLNSADQNITANTADKTLSKQKALDMLVDLSNADKVMNSEIFTKGEELLKISYAAGEYPYAKKMKTKRV